MESRETRQPALQLTDEGVATSGAPPRFSGGAKTSPRARGDVQAPPQVAEIDLRVYWRVLKKRKLLIAATAAVVFGMFVAWYMWKPRIYQATATIIIEPGAPKILPLQAVVELGTGDPWSMREYYNTQIRILKSSSLAKEVARKNPHLLRDTRLVSRAPAGAGDDELIARVAWHIQDGLRILPVRDSRVFGVGFVDRDPKLAAELANAVVAVFIEQNRAVKLDATRDASHWVSKQLDDARKDLDRSETALYSYKRDNNILSVNLEERQNLISKSLDDFSGALTAARKQRIELQARLRAIQGLMGKDAANAPSTYVATSEVIAPLRAAWLEEKRKLEALIGKYGPRWPDVIDQTKRTDSALADLRAEGNRMVGSLSAEIRALIEAEGNYSKELDKLKEEALELNEKAIAYKRLSRDAVNAQDIYSLLLKRLNESGLQEQDVTNNIRPLDAAIEPSSPIEPKLRQAVAFGASAGLLLSLMLAFLIEFLDRSVKSQEDIEVTLGLPFLGIVPSVATATPTEVRELHIMKHPHSSAAECCRVVRTNILFCSPDKPLKNLLVTSSNPVEGKTMTVVNIGVVMAQSGQRTLIVDTDMRRPRLHKILRASNEHGLSRVILGEGDLDDAVKSTDVPNLYLLPCGPVPPNPAEILQTERFAALVARLGEKFDRVIFDSPPIMAVTDAAVLSRVTDGVILVARAGRTTRDALARAAGQLVGVNSHLLGVVLNDVDLTNPHYSGYYGYANKYYGAAPSGAGSPDA